MSAVWSAGRRTSLPLLRSLTLGVVSDSWSLLEHAFRHVDRAGTSANTHQQQPNTNRHAAYFHQFEAELLAHQSILKRIARKSDDDFKTASGLLFVMFRVLRDGLKSFKWKKELRSWLSGGTRISPVPTHTMDVPDVAESGGRLVVESSFDDRLVDRDVRETILGSFVVD